MRKKDCPEGNLLDDIEGLVSATIKLSSPLQNAMK